MQTDPIGYGDGMNWYAYVKGDPINHRDPSGLDGVAIIPNADGSGVSSGIPAEVLISAIRAICGDQASCYTADTWARAGISIAAVGGALDGSMGLVRDMAKDNGIQYFQHSESRAIRKWIQAQRKLGFKVVLIAHSWGGNTSMKIAAKGNRLDGLITVDPVGMFRPSLTKVRDNVGYWIDYEAEHETSGGGNFWAKIGRSYNESLNGIADEYHYEGALNHVEVCDTYCKAYIQ